MKGSAYRLDGINAIASDGHHVWVANDRSNSVTEISAATGKFVALIKGKQYGFDIITSLVTNGTGVLATNLSTAPKLGYSVTMFNATTGRFVQLFKGASYGFNEPEAAAISSAGLNHAWIANIGSSTVTELKLR